NALPAQTSLFGSAFWLKPGISEVNCRIQNLRLDWWLWSSIAPLQFPPSPSLTVCGRRISLFQDSAGVYARSCYTQSGHWKTDEPRYHADYSPIKFSRLSSMFSFRYIYT